MKFKALLLAFAVFAVACGGDPEPEPAPTTTLAAEEYTLDDLSAEFLAWVTDQIDSQAATAYAETIVAQLNDTPDEAACFITDEPSVQCIQGDWTESLKEWSADCNPPRGAANVTCPDGDGTDDGPVAPLEGSGGAADAFTKLSAASDQLKQYDAILASLIAGTAQDIKYESDHGANYSRPCTAIQHYGATLLSEGGSDGVPEDVAIAVDELLFDAYEDIECVPPEAPSLGAAVQTPITIVKEAHNNIFQAHEGISNIINNNYEKYASDCNNRCQSAIADARTKNRSAWHELGQDILSIRTRDNGQTLNHAFWAADYWLIQLGDHWDTPSYAKHANNQLGISRDTLAEYIKKHENFALQGAEAPAPTPKTVIKGAYHLVFQAHEGMANVHHDLAKWNWECGDRCSAAIDDARDKTNKAASELGDDIMDMTTWDHGRTVHHAFAAADYWIGQTDQNAFPDNASKALYQLGILRDVLAAASK